MKIYLIEYRQLTGRVKILTLAFCLLVVFSFPNNAIGKMNMDPMISPLERQALPKWCQTRMIIHHVMHPPFDPISTVPSSVVRESHKLEKIIGERVYNSVHHYIFALNWINRYKLSFTMQYAGIENDRLGALNKAIKEFAYMRGLGDILKKNKLYYNLLLYEAYVYNELGNIKDAVKNYYEAMKTRPSYANAYIEYATLLNSAGKTADAIKILNIGLKKTKGNKLIKQMIASMKRQGTK